MARAIKVVVEDHVAKVLAAVSEMTEDGTMCDVLLGEGLKSNATLLLAACTKMVSVDDIKAALATSAAAKHIVGFIHRRKVELEHKDVSFELFKLSQLLGVEDCERASYDALRSSDKIVVAASDEENQKFLQRVSQYYQEGNEGDCQLEVLDEKEKMIIFRIKIHKIVVAAAASYFRPLWTGNFDGAEDVVKLPDIPKQHMLAILSLIYFGEGSIDQEELLPIYLSVDRLCILPNIVDAVLEKLKTVLNSQDAMRFSNIQTPCPLALRRIAVQKVLGNRSSFLSGAQFGTYASIADLDAAGGPAFVGEDWFKLPSILNMINILASPCSSVLSDTSMAHLLSYLKDWRIRVQSLPLSQGTQVCSRQDFVINSDEGKLSVNVGQYGMVDKIDDDGNAHINFAITGATHAVPAEHFDKLEATAELTLGMQIQALPGCSFHKDGTDYYQEHDVGTVSNFYTSDTANQRVKIFWDRSKQISTYPRSTWLSSFQVHQRVLWVRIEVRAKQSFTTNSPDNNVTVSVGTDFVIVGLLHPDGDALISLCSSSCNTYRVHKSDFQKLEIRSEDIELNVKMLVGSLVRWSRDCREPIPAGCLEALPSVYRLNELFLKVVASCGSIAFQELFEIAFKQAIRQMEGVSLDIACGLLESRSNLAYPLRQAAQSVVAEALSELVSEEVKFCADSGLECSADACSLILAEVRHAFIMHAAAKVAGQNLADFPSGQVSCSALLHFLQHTDLDRDQMQAFLIRLCDQQFDLVVEALCRKYEDVNHIIGNAMSSWKKQSDQSDGSVPKTAKVHADSNC